MSKKTAVVVISAEEVKAAMPKTRDYNAWLSRKQYKAGRVESKKWTGRSCRGNKARAAAEY